MHTHKNCPAGDPVAEDDVLAQIETDKVTIDIKYTAKEAGVLTHMLIATGDVVTVGQSVATVEMGAAPSAGAKKEAAAPPPPPPKEDAAPKEAAAEKKKAAPPPPPPPPPPKPQQAKPASAAAPPAGGASGGNPARPERRVKMTRLRMRVAERLKGAQNTCVS
eukprot:351815-Chlamydomonas_euryale.AAC.1